MLTISKTHARSVFSNTVQFRSTVLHLHSIPLGELPPPPPRACFGRDELIERIIGFAENLTPIALIGAGGIGKTSVALAVLHHDRIKARFGDNRRFIRCDQFPASRANFLSRLSKVIGARVENPEDMTPLRPPLSSTEMIITLDNAESILDPQGVNAREIFAVVEELSQFSNICLCITSRITTIPSDCRCLDVPTLSMDAAHSAFYQIYDNDERPDLIDDILEQLDFHPLSVTLLATVAYHNRWDTPRLTREWGQRQTDVLRTEHHRSLAATIELSLASPMFRELGSDARDLLGVVAFFPQGVCENNLDWLFSRRNTSSGLFSTISDRLFPTTPERKNTLDKLCVLSLTYRNNGFITMLAPLRDYFFPKNPKSSPLLRAIKKRYFHRLSASLVPESPGFGETRWITSEDVNVEHLLDTFTSIDANSDEVWKACIDFMRHLHEHKPRLIVLGPKIEGLPDDHRSKPKCLFALSRLFGRVGNDTEYKRLLTRTLQLQREQGNDSWVAQMLGELAVANRMIGLREEGIQQAKEALDIFERLRHAAGQAQCLIDLAWLLWEDKQLEAAEEAASRAISLIPEKSHQTLVCKSHRILGNIYRSKGEREKAISHFEVALGIASSLNSHDLSFWIHYVMAILFCDEDRFDDAHAHVEQAKSHTVNDPYKMGRAMGLQAWVWYKQHRLEEARSEALRAVDVFEKLGAARAMENCRGLLRDIQNTTAASGQSNFTCELLRTVLRSTPVNSSISLARSQW